MKFFLVLCPVLLAVFLGQSNAASYEAVDKVIQQLSSGENNNDVGKLAQKGWTEGMEFIKQAFDVVYEGVQNVSDSLENTSPENLIQSLKSTYDKFYELLIDNGVKFYVTLGQVAQIVGQEDCLIGEANQMLTASGEMFDALIASMDIGIQGINDGKDVAALALSATLKALQSSAEEINNLVIETTEKLKKSLSKELKPCTEDPQLVLRDNEAAEKSQLAQNAIKSVKDSADKALSKASSETQKEAIQVLRDGITKALKKLAVAGEEGYNAIEKASSIPNKDEALATVEKGIKKSENECVAAVSIGQLTLGRVYAIMGDTFNSPSFEAIVAVESTRAALMNTLENTLKIASQGIIYDSTKTALEAARDGVATAGASGYSQFVKTASMVMDKIVS